MINIFTSFYVKIIWIWAFPADRIYRERLNPAERVNDIRHPINLRLFNWRVPARVKVLHGSNEMGGFDEASEVQTSQYFTPALYSG